MSLFGMLLTRPRNRFTVADPGESSFFVEGDLFDTPKVIREQHETTAQVSRHPIERLSDGTTKITDHIEADPDKIQITAVVSNVPIGLAEIATTGLKDDLPEDTWTLLRSAIKNGVLFDITTTLEDYTSMAMVSLNAIRTVANSSMLEFTASFERVDLVDAIEVATSVTANSKRRGTPEANAEESEKATTSSFLKAIARRVTGP